MNKIDNANRRSIDETPDLPDVSTGVQMFFQKMTIFLIHKEQIDGYTDESKKKVVVTEGVRVPFSPQQLALKPEGERGWRFSKLYCVPNLRLKLDDIVESREVKYRVMASEDFSEYGYVSYDLVEDYRHEE